MNDGAVGFVDASGKEWELGLYGDAKALETLAGCGVELEGRKYRGRLSVQDWRVIAATDGSEPFIGPLIRHGSNLVIQDRTTNGLIVLEHKSSADMAEVVGDMVMVMGFVVGPQVVRVVAWQVLLEEDASR